MFSFFCEVFGCVRPRAWVFRPHCRRAARPQGPAHAVRLARGRGEGGADGEADGGHAYSATERGAWQAGVGGQNDIVIHFKIVKCYTPNASHY